MTDETEKFELSEDEKKLVEETISDYQNGIPDFGNQRRLFLKQISAITGSIMAYHLFGGEKVFAQMISDNVVSQQSFANLENAVNVVFKINGASKSLQVDSRMTLLDTLREKLQLTGSKKGCDHGQCGACTVIVDGRRVLSCLTLAAACGGKTVTTIEGLAKGRELHPVQAAFIKHDGFQCGFCTPGQICSAVALLAEAKKGEASYVTDDVRTKTKSLQLSDNEIRERMSGNICRCGAYQNIVAAISEVHTGKKVANAWKFTNENTSLLAGENLSQKQYSDNETI